MKLLIKAGLFFLILAAGFEASSQQQQTDAVFTLEECIDYALNNSTTIKNAKLDETSAKARVGETTGLGLPQINGELSYTNNFAIQTVFLPAVFFAEDPTSVPADAPSVPVRFGVKQTGQLGVSISQLIFDGSYIVGLQAANTYRELSNKNLKRSEIEVAEYVTKAYYAVLVNKERIALLENNYKRLDTLLYETKEMAKNGFAEKIDVDRIQVNFNNIQVQRKNTERALELSLALLKFQMGMEVTLPLELEGSLAEITLDEELFENEEFEVSKRIEFSALQTQKDLNVLDLKNNRAASLPKLSAFAGVGYNSGTDKFSELTKTSNWFEYGNWGLSLTIPVFSGLQRHYRVQQAKISVLKTENELKNLENSINLEIKQSRFNLTSLIESLKIQEENMQLAEEVVRVARIKYNEGVGSNLEVVDAESAFKEAETNYFNTLYDALVAKIDLQKALGKLR